MRPSPHCPPVPLAAQPKGSLRHYFVEGVMRGEQNTLADPSSDPKKRADKPKPPEPVVTKPKAKFQWPLDR